MNTLSFLSIRNKLVLIIFFVSMVVITVIGSVHFFLDIQHAKKTMRHDLTSLTELLGNRSSAALAFNIDDLATENLSSLLHINNIVKACVYKNTGDLFASYHRENLQVPHCPNGDLLPAVGSKFDSRYLVVVQEIFQKELLLGKIYLASDLTPIKAVLWNIGIFSLLALIGASLISFVLASWLQGFISKSILNITDVANSIIEKGDHSQRVTIRGADEVAKLGGAFNDMLDALEKQNAQINRIEKMDALGQLTGGIAHDVNNMLGVIVGYSDLLAAMLVDEPVMSKYVDEITHASERGAALTKKLLSFSKVNHEEASCCNMNTLLLNLQHMLSRTLTSRVELTLNLEKEPWPVWIDEGGLADVILNFSINAMHAIEGNGRLDIQTLNITVSDSAALSLGINQGDYVLLSFVDTGCGMDKDTLSHVFEPFYTTKGDNGTGLGLSQAYGYMKQFDGVIKVESQPGEGSTFSLYFPRYSKKLECLFVTENQPVPSVQAGSGVILLVDDEVALLALNHELLEKNGYTVISVDSAEKALDILAHQEVDLLISDIVMPKIDGYQLASIVNERFPQVKIQLVSGCPDANRSALKDKTLSDNMLMKPVKLDTLLNRVNALLNSEDELLDLEA